MLRFTVSELGQAALPAVDLEAPRLVIGSGAAATLRLPAQAARDEHVVIAERRWVALAPIEVDGAPRVAGDAGPISDGLVLGIGPFRVAISTAPAGSLASLPQRTESLALELVRGMLGAGAAPSLEVLRGPVVGAKRTLPPPEATLVIGRGDAATWVILDEDLSRTHAEIRRGWDGVTIRDLGSNNGTRLDGVEITDPTPLRDGMEVTLGKVVLRFADPAERHLHGAEATPAARPLAIRAAAAAPVIAPPRTPSPSSSAARSLPFVVATVIAAIAVAGLVWVLAS